MNSKFDRLIDKFNSGARLIDFTTGGSISFTFSDGEKIDFVPINSDWIINTDTPKEILNREIEWAGLYMTGTTFFPFPGFVDEIVVILTNHDCYYIKIWQDDVR